MDINLLLTHADIKEQFETILVQQLTVADSTKKSMTIGEHWSELKEALTTVAQAAVPKAISSSSRYPYIETRSFIAERQSRYPKMDEQERIEMQKKIN